MGYQREKEKADRKWRKFKIIVFTIALIAIVGFSVFSIFAPPSSWRYRVNTPKISKRVEGEMRLHFLNVGQGDCTLIELPDGKTMLIDTGDGRESTAKTILRYLNALKIERIDYFVITHPDIDHCGAADEIVKNKEVVSAYLPAVYPDVNKEYLQAYESLLQEGCKMVFSSMKEKLSFLEGETAYTLCFLYPYSLDTTEENWGTIENNMQSSILWLDYHGVSALFTGDAPMDLEEELLSRNELDVFTKMGVDLSSTEILKVAHHGSNQSTSLDLLELLHAQTAIISCGKNNVYGHPSQEVLDNLGRVGAQAFRTDLDGNVMITVSKDGRYVVQCEKKTGK